MILTTREPSKRKSDHHHRGNVSSGGVFVCVLACLIEGSSDMQIDYSRTWENKFAANYRVIHLAL